MTIDSYNNLISTYRIKWTNLNNWHNNLCLQGKQNNKLELKLLHISNLMDILTRYNIDQSKVVTTIKDENISSLVTLNSFDSSRMQIITEYLNKLIGTNLYFKF